LSVSGKFNVNINTRNLEGFPVVFKIWLKNIKNIRSSNAGK